MKQREKINASYDALAAKIQTPVARALFSTMPQPMRIYVETSVDIARHAIRHQMFAADWDPDFEHIFNQL